MKAKIGATFTPIRTNFKEYPDYVFDIPMEETYIPELDVFESNLDNNGEAKVNFIYNNF